MNIESGEMISCEVAANICHVRLHDRPRKNALSAEMIAALTGVVARINSAPDVRVVVFTGYDDVFCAGGNVKAMRDRTEVFASEEPFGAYQDNVDQIHVIALAMRSLSVPTIAAVNGCAIGGGLDLALMCDLRIASDKSVFSEAFLRWGLMPGDGGAWLLQRVVGLPRALELALTCRMVDAREALAMGLVSQVVEQDALPDAATRLAERIAGFPPEAVKLTKRLVHASADLSLEHSLFSTALAQGIAQTSGWHIGAVAASGK